MIGTNAISFLQVIQNDFASLESETREAESEVLRVFDEFTLTSEFAQWCRRACMLRWRITRIQFTSGWEESTVIYLSCERIRRKSN